ncbi:MAG: HlyD family secretion protein [Limnohabitans sp.]|jgi:multidrug resistance efflux pump|uniref:HlyD family secretion protein n=1 Tax=Limnohabitans sp. TaxID=1907725 RepID=UPI00391991D1
MHAFTTLKPIKRLLGLGVLLIAFVVIVPAMANFQSVNAIVNTHYVVVKSPIEGTLDGFSIMPGQPIEQGAELVRINNTRFKESAVNEMAVEQKTLAERSLGLQQHLKNLQQLQKELQNRVSVHRNHEFLRLEEQLAQAKAEKKAQESLIREQQLLAQRNALLLKENFISQAQSEAAHYALEVTQSRLDIFQARIRLLETEKQAIQRFVYLGEGRNDVPYTQQRLDDVRLQITEVAARLRENEQRSADIQWQISKERDNMAVSREVLLQSPSKGVLWRKFGSNGTEVLIGTDLAHVITCENLFLDVAVPESSLESFQIGQPVQYRLIGTTQWLTGHIQAVTGSGNNLQDVTLVAQLQREKKDARIFVKIESSDLNKPQENLCFAGRKVDVKVPREWRPSVWLSRVSSFLM